MTSWWRDYQRDAAATTTTVNGLAQPYLVTTDTQAAEAQRLRDRVRRLEAGLRAIQSQTDMSNATYRRAWQIAEDTLAEDV